METIALSWVWFTFIGQNLFGYEQKYIKNGLTARFFERYRLQTILTRIADGMCMELWQKKVYL